MALPKRQHSRSRRNKRRAHDFLTPPNVVECPNCHEPRLSHHACPSCGMYKGRQVLKMGEE